MLPALAHLPPAHIKTSIELGIGEIRDVIEKEKIEESFVEKWVNLQYISKILAFKTLLQIRSHPLQSKNRMSMTQPEK